MARDLLKRMLERNPGKRTRAAEALRHPWLQEPEATSALPLRSSVVQRLQRFATYGHLKQLVLRIIADDMAEHPTTHKESQVGPPCVCAGKREQAAGSACGKPHEGRELSCFTAALLDVAWRLPSTLSSTHLQHPPQLRASLRMHAQGK